MTFALRGGTVAVTRHGSEEDARRATDAALPGTPIFLGNWDREEGIASLVARDREESALWTGIVQEGDVEPWVVPCFGSLLIVSSENALLVGEDARIVAHDAAGWRFSQVLIGETVVWIAGDYEARRVTGAGFETFLPARSECDLWRLRGDDLEARLTDGEWELLG